MKLSRKAIQRMVDSGQVNVGGRRTGSGGGGGGGVSATWVEENYISKAFFSTLFTIHGHDADDTAVPPTDVIIEPNDTETVLDSIEAMVGLWTEKYLSALGQGSGGGGGGGTILTEPLASINEAGLGTPSGSNKVIAWNGSRWEYKTYGSGNGTVTSIGAGTGLASSTGGAITTSGTLSISSDYQTKISHGETAYDWGNHANAGYLTASSSVITTLQNYFDASGHAKSALKLTTVSKTAWGQTYWTANGVPDSISGNMTNVGNISFSDTGKNIGSIAYFDTTNHRLGIGSAPGAYKLDVNGDIRTSGNLYIGGTNRILSGGGDSAKNLLEFDGTQVALAYGFRTSNETRIYGQNISMYHGSTLKVQVTSTGLKIGDATLSWDSTNHALKIDTGFYSESFISALGAGSGGSTSGITMADVWTALAMSAPNESSQQIHVSHLAQALNNYAQKTWVSSNMVTISTPQAISGQKTFTGGIIMASNLVPSTDNQYSIGTEQKRINGVFVNGQVYVSGMTIHYQSGSGLIGGYYLSAGSTNIILETSGNVWQRTTSQYYSDMRLKDVISDVDLSVEQIAGAPVFNFKWKDDEGDMQVGSSAQYWHKHLKPVTAIASNGQYGMDYGRAALISSVIVARKVMNHEERIAALEKENKELKEKLETLKAS